MLSKCLLNRAVCLQDIIFIFYHKCWSECFRFALLWVYLPRFPVNPGGLCLNRHLYSGHLALCLAPGRHSVNNEWKLKKKKFLKIWSNDNSVKTNNYSLWGWVSNRGQNLGNLGPRPEAPCPWTSRVWAASGVPLPHCWGLGAGLLASQQYRLVDTVGEPWENWQ